eukprot:1437399-Prymnesium_polylepis.1
MAVRLAASPGGVHRGESMLPLRIQRESSHRAATFGEDTLSFFDTASSTSVALCGCAAAKMPTTLFEPGAASTALPRRDDTVDPGRLAILPLLDEFLDEHTDPG